MFNVGDRVKYKDKAKDPNVGRYYNGYKAGLIGTVVSVQKESGEDHATIEFDKEQPEHTGRMKSLYGSRNGCYCQNLEYISYKYDPTQAGDTDDDV